MLQITKLLTVLSIAPLIWAATTQLFPIPHQFRVERQLINATIDVPTQPPEVNSTFLTTTESTTDVTTMNSTAEENTTLPANNNNNSSPGYNYTVPGYNPWNPVAWQQHQPVWPQSSGWPYQQSWPGNQAWPYNQVWGGSQSWSGQQGWDEGGGYSNNLDAAHHTGYSYGGNAVWGDEDIINVHF